MSFLKLTRINGLLFPPDFSPENVKGLADFSFLPDDLFVVTYPKSGTTWTQQIVKLIKQGGEDTMHLTDAVPWIEYYGKDVFAPPPRAYKSHLPYHMMPGGEPAKSVAKYIYVARNPKDVAVSFYYHACHFKSYEFDGDWNCFFELYMKGKVEFGSWFDHVLGWWEHKDADNILFMKYEDMKKDLQGSVEKIAQFMGYSLDDAMIDKITQQCTFDSMKANPLADIDKHAEAVVDLKENSAPFLRKGIVGDWRNHFTDEQSSRFDDEYAKRMTGSGLEFLYN